MSDNILILLVGVKDYDYYNILEDLDFKEAVKKHSLVIPSEYLLLFVLYTWGYQLRCVLVLKAFFVLLHSMYQLPGSLCVFSTNSL